MTAPATAAATAPTRNRLSVPQMLHVMRVEFFRGYVQKYPITCLMIGIDGLDALYEKHGYEGKQQVMNAAYDLLRSVTQEKSCFGMALMAGDRIMAVLPNNTPARAGELGALLNERARALPLAVKGEHMTLRLSLGASQNLHEDTESFDGFVEMAHRAMSMAKEAGGDRFLMWRETETELAELRDELQQHSRAFQEQHALLVEEISELGGMQEAAILDKMQEIFSSVARTPEIARLEREIIALAARELKEERQKAIQAQVAEHQKQIDVLERRIAKLSDVLGLTESELRRIMAAKGIEPGVASIYRAVQGLAGDDAQREAKAALMVGIFKANLSLQKGQELATASA